MEIFKEYYKVKNSETELKLELNYSAGGMNYFTGNAEKRGYYLSCSPVERTENSVTFKAFSGVKQLMNEVKRKSKKQETIAIEKAHQEKQELLNMVAKKNGLVLAE